MKHKKPKKVEITFPEKATTITHDWIKANVPDWTKLREIVSVRLGSVSIDKDTLNDYLPLDRVIHELKKIEDELYGTYTEANKVLFNLYEPAYYEDYLDPIAQAYLDRPETDEELLNRLKRKYRAQCNTLKHKIKTQAALRKRELATYKRLKKKFEADETNTQ
jgi:oligoribonuclease NrnB/cAMP/cGMP phosphodiesterase (DHH superfamily)